MQTTPQKPGHGQCGWVGRHFFGKRLSALILDKQEFFPLFIGTATDTDVHAFSIQASGQDVIRIKSQCDIMALLKHLNNEKSAHAETPAMQYPTSCLDPTTPIPFSLNYPIIRPALLLILLLFSSSSALAYDCEVAGIYYNLNPTDKTASVTYKDYNHYSGDVVIPENIAYDGTTYSVTSIGYEAFRNCDRLTSVTIPNSVTSIGVSAFSGCSGLSSVTIPNSVTSIGNYAFSRCSGLTSVTIPNSVTSIDDYAFGGCSGLTSVTIPNSVTSIDDYAFSSCSGLTSVTIPNSVTSIGDGAFFDCSGLTSVSIPNSVTSIGKHAFAGCSGLTSVTVDKNNGTYDSRDNCNAIIETSTNKLIVGCNNTIIPNSVTAISEYAFFRCSGLTSVTIPNSVTSIGDGAFCDCTGLTFVSIPNSVTAIGEYAFSNCSGLTSVSIPNSVTSIGDCAFSSCSGLTSVTIGNSVTSIGKYAFCYCSRLTKLVSLAVEPPTCGIGAFIYVDKTSCQLLVPEESINKYKTADQWKEFLDISGYNGVDDISVDTPDALYEVYNLQGVRVGSGMREEEVSAGTLPHGVYILVSPQNRKKLKI